MFTAQVLILQIASQIWQIKLKTTRLNMIMVYPQRLACAMKIQNAQRLVALKQLDFGFTIQTIKNFKLRSILSLLRQACFLVTSQLISLQTNSRFRVAFIALNSKPAKPAKTANNGCRKTAKIRHVLHSTKQLGEKEFA